MKIKLLILILITTNCLTWPDKPTLLHDVETLEKIKKPALIDLNGNPIKPIETFSNSENLLNVNETGFKLLFNLTLISSELPESGSKQSSLGYKKFKHPKEKPFLPSGFSSRLNIKDPELEQFIIHTILNSKNRGSVKKSMWLKLLKKFRK